MNYMPKIGSRVTYFGELRKGPPPNIVTGIVTKHYPGYRDEQGHDIPDAVTVRVDTIPSWWPYTDTDLFAPDVSEIELVR